MIDGAAPSHSTRQARAAFALACASLVLSLITCAGLGILVVTNPPDLLPVQSRPQVASAGQVETIAHLTLPPATVLLTAAYSDGLETRLSAKFRIPRTALDAFIASAKFSAPLTPGLRAVNATHNVGGGDLWDPDSATTVSGIDEEQPTADGTYRTLLLNLDAPDTITVYLYADRN